MVPSMFSKDITIRSRLRDATAADHARLDVLAAKWNIARRDDYALFLKAQARALFGLEAALEESDVARVLSDWPQRRRRHALQQDIESLGEALPEALPVAAFSSEAEIFGTLYVLEGSRLGARFLLKQMADAALPTAFLRHGEGKHFWQSFLERLEQGVGDAELAGCIQSARCAFSLFEGSFGRVLTAQTTF